MNWLRRDQRVPTEASLERGEDLRRHRSKPRLSLIFVLHVLLDDVGENMCLCDFSHIKKPRQQLVNVLVGVRERHRATRLSLWLIETRFDHRILPGVLRVEHALQGAGGLDDLGDLFEYLAWSGGVVNNTE